MIRHVWSVLCSQSVTDQQTNNISLFNVIEQIEATLAKSIPQGVLPPAPLPLELVSLWERVEADDQTVGTAVVDVLDASGNRIGGREMGIDVTAHRRCRTRLILTGIPITGSGRYTVQVAQRSDDEGQNLVAEIPLDVTLHAPADPIAEEVAS